MPEKTHIRTKMTIIIEDTLPRENWAGYTLDEIREYLSSGEGVGYAIEAMASREVPITVEVEEVEAPGDEA